MLGIDILRMFGGVGGSSGGGGGSSSGAITLDSNSLIGDDYVEWKIDNDGFTYSKTTLGGFYHLLSAWISPQTGMELYEIRATFLNGDLPTGNLSTWEALNADRSWSLDDVNFHCQLLMEIRLASTASVLDDATITLSTRDFEFHNRFDTGG